MNALSRTCALMISKATPNATSSPVSASGPTPCARPVGLMTALCGPEVARANLSARQAKAADLLTSGTYGPPSTGSSNSAALTLSLGSRLRAKTASLGSTLFRLTWKARVTSAGRSICALRASGRLMEDSAFIGWQSPRARGDAGGQRWRTGHCKNLEDQARWFCLIRGQTIEEVSRLSLSTRFVRRLMGLPSVWDDCGATVTLSSRRSPKASSKR